MNNTEPLRYRFAERLFHPREYRHKLPTLTMAEALATGYPFDGTRNVSPNPLMFPPSPKPPCHCVTCRP